MNTHFPYHTIQLQRKDHYAEVREQEEHILRYADLREWRCEQNRHLVRRLRISVFGIDHPKRHVIRYPADWLEALKERFAPACVRDKWPVKYTEISFSLEESYPYFQPQLPEKHAVLKLHTHTNIAEYTW